jgi:hypothetical protein
VARLQSARLAAALGVLYGRRFRACTEIHRQYLFAMSTVFDIENAVQKLSRNDLTMFRDWFLGFDATAWDKQFEDDVAAGLLDALVEEATATCAKGAARICEASRQPKVLEVL